MTMVIEIEPEVDCFKSSFQKTQRNRKVRFDCTGAYRMHVSPRRETPQAAQNYVKQTHTKSRNLFCLEEYEQTQKMRTKRVSKGVKFIPG